MTKFLTFVLIFNTLTITAQVNVFEAAKTGDLNVLKKVYSQDKSIINTTNSDGYLPLTLACYYGQQQIVDFLIDKVDDINGNSKYGTPLMAAAVKGYIPIVKKLLQFGANPNVTDKNNTTALHYALIFKNKPMVMLLLEYNAKTTIKDNNGNTALDYAILINDEEINQTLKTK